MTCTFRPLPSFTVSSEFDPGLKEGPYLQGRGEEAIRGRDESLDRGNVLADGSLFASRSELSTRGALVPLPTPVPRVDPSESVSKPQTLHPSTGAVLLTAIRRCLSGTGDVRTPNLSGSQRRKGFLSRWTAATPRHLSPFRIG